MKIKSICPNCKNYDEEKNVCNFNKNNLNLELKFITECSHYNKKNNTNTKFIY